MAHRTTQRSYCAGVTDVRATASEMPVWDGFLLPILQVLHNGVVRQAREVQDLVADHVGLSDLQRAEVLGSGQLRYRNRIGWAISSLNRAGPWNARSEVPTSSPSRVRTCSPSTRRR